jgi:hypothetical protein
LKGPKIEVCVDTGLFCLSLDCIRITKSQTFQPENKLTNNPAKTAQRSTFKIFFASKHLFNNVVHPDLRHEAFPMFLNKFPQLHTLRSIFTQKTFNFFHILTTFQQTQYLMDLRHQSISRLQTKTFYAIHTLLSISAQKTLNIHSLFLYILTTFPQTWYLLYL